VDLSQYREATWNADEFVAVANLALQEVLHGAALAELNLRIVRHYTGLGMLDEPTKSGKEARYHYRHLLQLLLVRRLLGQGYGSAAILDFPRKQDNERILQLLFGQLELTVKSNPALAFLEEVRQRTAKPSATSHCSHWTRLVPLPGFEVNVNEDFRCPSQALLDQALETVRRALTQRR
jgi:hypothetical protein